MTDTDNNDDLERLRLKTQKGIMNVIEGILSNPEFQKRINKAFTKQSVKMGLFLSFLIVGIITLLNTFKTICNVGWMGDLIFGTILILVGTLYIVKEVW